MININSLMIDNTKKTLILDSLKNMKDENTTNKNRIHHYMEYWDILKKFTNPYEFIYTSSIFDMNSLINTKPVSRSYFKMIEMIHTYNLIDFNAKYIKTVHLAEAPGGFIQALCDLINKNNPCLLTNIHGISLMNSSSIKWKLPKQYINKYNIHLNTQYNTGDLLDYYQIQQSIYLINNNYWQLHTVDFITADGGFDFSNDYNNQEDTALLLIVSQIYTILQLLSNGGHAVIKIFDILTDRTIKLLYVLYTVFDTIELYKPKISRPTNSEKYIICKHFNNTEKGIFFYKKILSTCIVLKDTSKMDVLFNDRIPIEFYECIYNYSTQFNKNLIDSIDTTLNEIKKYSKTDNKKQYLTQLYLKNIDNCKSWQNTFYNF